MIKIEIGDEVFHRPSREWWRVCRADNGYVYPAGWPPCRADVADCLLVDKATPAERESTITDCRRLPRSDDRHIAPLERS